MRFCEECKSTKPFTMAEVQPLCDECTHEWIELHSKRGKKIEEHKDLLLKSQFEECVFCTKQMNTIAKAAYHEDETYSYAALCGECYRRFKLLGFDISLVRYLVDAIGFHNAHQESMTVKDKKWLTVCMNSGPLFSTCSKGQYFSVIVSEDGKLLSEGWNGVPSGALHCSQGGCNRAVDLAESNASYVDCTAQHAEVNALQNVAKEQLEGATIYVNGTPCHECVRAIVHSKIKRVVFFPQEKYNFVEAIRMMGKFGVSAVYIEDATALEKKKEDLKRDIRRTYKTNAELIEDIDHAKKMLAYLQFNKMMGRVAACNSK